MNTPFAQPKRIKFQILPCNIALYHNLTFNYMSAIIDFTVNFARQCRKEKALIENGLAKALAYVHMPKMTLVRVAK
jgi:hypothetical protein